MLAQSLQLASAQLRRRFRAIRFVERLGASTAAALVACAVIALLARFFLGWSAAHASWLLVPAAGAPLWAWWRATRATPSDATCLAWLDQRAGGRGLVLAGVEAGEGEWLQRATSALALAPRSMPALPLRPLWPALPAIAFALSALLVPISAAPPRATVVRKAAAEELREQLAALSELGLDPVLREELEQRLERIEELADAPGAESTWEAIDALDQQLARESAQTAEQLLDARTAAEDIAKGESTGDAAAEQLQQLAQQLGNAPKGEAPAPASPSSAPGEPPSPEQLAKSAQQTLAGLDQRLQQLVEKGLLDPRSLAQAKDMKRREPRHQHNPECKPGGT